MTRRTVRIAMNGVTGRMGYRQHLVRSLLAIREQGGLDLGDGTVLWPEPVLVGRREHALRRSPSGTASSTGPPTSTRSLADATVDIYFDAQVTSGPRGGDQAGDRRRQAHLHREAHRHRPRRRAGAGPARRARPASSHGVVQDKLFLPGPAEAQAPDRRRLLRPRSCRSAASSATGSSRATGRAPSGPSWNYRAEDGGGIVVDMFPHWEYVLHELFGRGPQPCRR